MGWEHDRALLQAWREGDESSGGVLVREHFVVVRRFFSSKVPEAVDDLVQSTFLACARSSTPLRPGVRFRAMILGFARVELMRYLRQRRRLERRLNKFEQQGLDQRQPTSPTGVVARHERQERLHAIVEQLALPLRLTVELRYFEQLSIEEVADALGIAEGTVKSRLNRARKLIREAYGPGSDDSLRRSQIHSGRTSDPA